MITQSILKELFDYDHETGVFTWRPRKEYSIGKYYKSSSWNTKFAGKTAGSDHSEGYWKIGIDGKQYLAHRLAWLYVYGKWPEDQLDHVDNIRNHNWISNIREANRSENNQNQIKAQKRNKSTGLLGASFNKRYGTFIAQIAINGKNKSLGVFKTAIEAHDAYITAKRELHPYNTL